MKMRGYSVLFVCALCVFVLCGAAVVAQVETPEKKAAETAKGIAERARKEAEDALNSYKPIENDATTAASSVGAAEGAITGTKTNARKILKPGPPAQSAILEGIEKLEKSAQSAKEEVDALKTADVATFTDQKTRETLTKKMDEVDAKMTELEAAADAITDEIPAIDDVIKKSDVLEIAAEEARDLWDDAVQGLDTQIDAIAAALGGVNAVKDAIEKAVESFAKNKDDNTDEVTTALSDDAKTKLETSLEKINEMKNKSEKTKEFADYAREQYDALALEAGELKRMAEDRKQKLEEQNREGGHVNLVQLAQQQMEEYSAGPLCSLALPAFFFLCVLFGM